MTDTQVTSTQRMPLPTVPYRLAAASAVPIGAGREWAVVVAAVLAVLGIVGLATGRITIEEKP